MLVFEEDDQAEAEPNDGIMRRASGPLAVWQCRSACQDGIVNIIGLWQCLAVSGLWQCDGVAERGTGPGGTGWDISADLRGAVCVSPARRVGGATFGRQGR